MKKIIFLLLIIPIVSSAQTLEAFGGPILTIDPTCLNGQMLTILKYYRYYPGLPPTLTKVETFMFQPGVSQLLVGSLVIGAQTLGLAFPGGACLKLVCSLFGCVKVPTPTNYIIFFIGTNL